MLTSQCRVSLRSLFSPPITLHASHHTAYVSSDCMCYCQFRIAGECSVVHLEGRLPGCPSWTLGYATAERQPPGEVTRRHLHACMLPCCKAHQLWGELRSLSCRFGACAWLGSSLKDDDAACMTDRRAA